MSGESVQRNLNFMILFQSVDHKKPPEAAAFTDLDFSTLMQLRMNRFGQLVERKRLGQENRIRNIRVSLAKGPFGIT